MTIQDELTLSYYQTVGIYDEKKKIELVKHIESGQIFFKKTLSVFNTQIYRYLLAHPIPNTPQIFACIPDGEQLIIIEEYITGTTLLNKLVSSDFKLMEAQLTDWMHQLLLILEDLQRQTPPIIHRDIKPDNIILTREGRIKLIDFNAARFFDETKKHEKDTTLLGTNGFAAPEQYGFFQSDCRCDLYSFGILFNYLLIGKISNQTLCSGKWHPLLVTCTQMDPALRYENATALHRDFLKIAASSHSPETSQRRPLPTGSNTQYGQATAPTSENAVLSDTVKRTDQKKKSVERNPLKQNPTKGNSVKKDSVASSKKNASKPTLLTFLQRLLPPGYRTRKVWKMVLASFGYFLLSLCCLTITLEPPVSELELRIFKLSFFLAGLVVILYPSNYLGIQKYIPGSLHPNPILRLLIIALWGTVFFFAIILVGATIASFVT